MLPLVNREWFIRVLISTYAIIAFGAWRGILQRPFAMFWKENPTSSERNLQKRESLVEKVEQKTKRTVYIETALTNENLATSNPQYDSPLYQLPKEIRDVVFEYACTQSPDPAHTYDTNAYYYSPDHPGRLKTYTSLLRTCRRAWLETNALPMPLAEHAFWFQRGPYDQHPDSGWVLNIRDEKARYDRLLQRCTKTNIQQIKYIHYFLQMFQLDTFSQSTHIASHVQKAKQRGLQPKTFHITIRHTDWFNWERDQRLHFNERNVQALLDGPQLEGIKEFKLELETLVDNRSQLDDIVERLQKLEGRPKLEDPTNRDCPRAYKFVIRDKPLISYWSRSSRLDNQEWEVYAGIPTLHLRVVTLIWKAEQVSATDPDVQRPVASTIEQSSVWPIPRHTRRFPLHIMRTQRRQDDLHRAGWAGSIFPDQDDDTRVTSMNLAKEVEKEMRSRFERLMGDCDARMIAREWNLQGSLLKFEGLDLDG